jgi:hypothetical protein
MPLHNTWLALAVTVFVSCYMSNWEVEISILICSEKLHVFSTQAETFPCTISFGHKQFARFCSVLVLHGKS